MKATRRQLAELLGCSLRTLETYLPQLEIGRDGRPPLVTPTEQPGRGRELLYDVDEVQSGFALLAAGREILLNSRRHKARTRLPVPPDAK